MEAEISIAEKIQDVRKRLGLTKDVFGKLFGSKSGTTVHSWEMGNTVPRRDICERVYRAYKCEDLPNLADIYKLHGTDYSLYLLLCAIFDNNKPEKK